MSKGQPALPPYLLPPAWPRGTVPLARLRPLPQEGRWLLTGDPQVAMVAKRMFPGARSHGPGSASFPDTPRSLQELSWLMQRFPVAAEAGHSAAFSAACRSARDHAIRRSGLEAAPRPRAGARFTGTARPYQEEGLAFMLANERVLVADEMGVGKTVSALMLLASGTGFPALVVPQPHLVSQWIGMADRFLDTGPGGLRVAAVRGRGTSKEDVKHGRDRLPDADIVIMHYGLVSHWAERLLEARMPTVVFDEISELRHRGTDKYGACSRVASAAKHVVGLSGTPIYNHGDEIWSIMDVIDFQCLGPRDDFVREWCTPRGTHHPVSDPAALGAYLRREGLMIRRRKRDKGVIEHIPPKHRAVEIIDGDDGVFRERMRGAVPLLRKFGAADRYERFSLAGRIGEEARRATGLAKAAAAAAFIGTLLEAGEPVVAFAYHHDVVDSLLEALRAWNPACYTGREDARTKDTSKASFVAGDTNLLIVSLRSTQGIDGLQQRCRVGVVCELDWSPAVHGQAEDRLWRDGQEEPVMIYYLVTSTGSDPDMQAKLGLKIGQSKGILDDPFETDEEREADETETRGFVSTLVERLAAEYAAA